MRIFGHSISYFCSLARVETRIQDNDLSRAARQPTPKGKYTPSSFFNQFSSTVLDTVPTIKAAVDLSTVVGSLCLMMDHGQLT